MLPATPEADELQQLPLELPRYLLVALRESGGHRAYALLPPYASGGGWPGGDTMAVEPVLGIVKKKEGLRNRLFVHLNKSTNEACYWAGDRFYCWRCLQQLRGPSRHYAFPRLQRLGRGQIHTRRPNCTAGPGHEERAQPSFRPDTRLGAENR